MKCLLAINWIIDHHAPYIAQCSSNCRAFDPLHSVLKRLSFLFAVIDGSTMSSQSPNAKASGAGVGGGSTPGHLSGHHQQPSPATMPAPALQQQQQVWPLTHFFLFPSCENSLIRPEGKSMTPHRGNTIFFCSSQQLPRLRLGPLKGFLS